MARSKDATVGLSELESAILREAISGTAVCVGTCAELFPEYTDKEISAAIKSLHTDLGVLKPAEDREPDLYMCYVYDRRGVRRLRAAAATGVSSRLSVTNT